jgi:hypothetical protein
MAKRQTQRSVSLRAEYYATAEAAARRFGVSVSAFIEGAMRRQFDALGIEVLDRDAALARLGKEPIPVPKDFGGAS